MGLEHRRGTARLGAEVEVLADRDPPAPSFSTRTYSMKSSAVRWENSSSKGITTSSSTPSPSITSRLISGELISFGAASGRSTSSGWGSKLSTVSAPSITARWPRWTPSKVPIATSRARGVTSSSGVTLIDISPTFSPKRVADRRDQLGDLADRHLATGLLDPERARPRPGADLRSRRPRGSRPGSARRSRRCIRSRSRRRSPASLPSRSSARRTSTSRTGVSMVSPRCAFL